MLNKSPAAVTVQSFPNSSSVSGLTFFLMEGRLGMLVSLPPSVGCPLSLYLREREYKVEKMWTFVFNV